MAMFKKNNKSIKSIELFQEKSGEVVRVIRFKKSSDFDHFLFAFKSMRYPGYNWRYINKNKRRKGKKVK
jgi:hypothetical protein